MIIIWYHDYYLVSYRDYCTGIMIIILVSEDFILASAIRKIYVIRRVSSIRQIFIPEP